MEAANIYETFLGVRLCAKPSMIFSFNPYLTLEDNTHFAEGETQEQRVTEVTGDQGRIQTPRAEAPDLATSALPYNFWLFTETHESVNHFHSHELYQSPQSATSPWGMTSAHLRAFNQTSREMKPTQG